MDAIWPLVIAVGLAVVWILLGRESAERQLTRLSGQERADNLIEDERRRVPGLTREQAAQRIMQALRRDSS